MPLRDHFHSPIINRHRWEGFHAGWPAMLVSRLQAHLPPRYLAERPLQLQRGDRRGHL